MNCCLFVVVVVDILLGLALFFSFACCIWACINYFLGCVFVHTSTWKFFLTPTQIHTYTLNLYIYFVYRDPLILPFSKVVRPCFFFLSFHFLLSCFKMGIINARVWVSIPLLSSTRIKLYMYVYEKCIIAYLYLIHPIPSELNTPPPNQESMMYINIACVTSKRMTVFIFLLLLLSHFKDFFSKVQKTALKWTYCLSLTQLHIQINANGGLGSKCLKCMLEFYMELFKKSVNIGKIPKSML